MASGYFTLFLERENQATGYAIQHIPVPVPIKDKLGGLQQEGYPA